jgi:alpha-2-macroglobulin
MKSGRSAASLVLLALAFAGRADAQGSGPLRVIRATPSGSAGPSAQVAVTFDRPVAGSLDRTVDPASILRIEPAVRGRLEWRDPVTIRFTPTDLLESGRTYTVSVAPTFRAMDGSALAGEYSYTFRVQGPALLGGKPVSESRGEAQHVALDQRFDVVYSAPVDLRLLSSGAFLEFDAACAGAQRIVRLVATRQQPIPATADWRIREAGGWQRDHSADSLRRIIQLVPDAPLPYGCRGDLVAPTELAAELPRGLTRWPFRTYGEFRLTSVQCQGGGGFCPTGPLVVTFSNPVRGAEVARKLKLIPEAKFTVHDTTAESAVWALGAKLQPRTGYAIVADTAMRDVFGQTLRGNPAMGHRTTGYAPAVDHVWGRVVVEKNGSRTLAVEHVNVDTLVATIAPVPAAVLPRLLSRFGRADDSLWTVLLASATVQRIPVRATPDRPMLTGVRIEAPAASGGASVFAVKVIGRSAGSVVSTDVPATLVNVTDLGVHARVGLNDAAVWVTGVNDGRARASADVVLRDAAGKSLATGRTDARGLVRFTGFAAAADTTEIDDDEYGGSNFEGYVEVTLGQDRAVTAVNQWDPDLSPWRFNVSSAFGDRRWPMAGAVFTERGIYRPGERVHAKAIVRDGALGALRAPPAGDSIRWTFKARDGATLREATVRLTSFGTSAQSLELPEGSAIGQYAVQVHVKRRGTWRHAGTTTYRVAEYRPPEFLVNVNAETATRLPGDTFRGVVQARYLFGAPMGRADVAWAAQQTALYSYELDIPGMDGWYLGEMGSWWEERAAQAEVFGSGRDTLDAKGETTLSVKLPVPPKGRAARVSLMATITDINRQVVGASATTVVHPAEFYVAVKPLGASYFWQAGTPQSVSINAVRPTGETVTGVRVQGTAIRREWHRVRRVRDGVSELVGEWVSDTSSLCTVTTTATPVTCTFTPTEAGEYTVGFTATDGAGRDAKTSFSRWASGPGWVPWSDESQFKMDVIPDRPRYSVGDTATVLFASPFTDAEAWITVEREGLIHQRRVRITAGSTTLKFPITEAYAPNAFVSIVVARGRSAASGPLDDPGRPTIRVGYAELRVTPEVKRLTVTLSPEKPEYRPGDSARVHIQVRDVRGGGPRSEVTLWAVDEGVLALTGYKVPDPLDLLYQARGVGMRLASNMTAVAPQVAEGEKGQREPGGGGGADRADILRSRFQTTAFFIGSVVTDAQGNATVTAKLQDNLTTFRLMAVAVTAGDRYGNGQSSLLVTRPLLARAALPRFVRPADRFTAGTVVNRRDATASEVRVAAAVTGVTMIGSADRTVTLAESRGAEVRFPFVAGRGDSASFRFDVTGSGDADAVRVAVPIRPDQHPRATTFAGVLRDTATVEMALPPGVDAARSRLSLSIGVSPLATIAGMSQSLHIYPYYCSEQVISTAVPLIALYGAQRQGGRALLRGNPERDIALAVAMLSRRQRPDGGIGYWSSNDWSTSWLSAYAGIVLLDARDVGVAVDSAVLERLARFVTLELSGRSQVSVTPVANWYARTELRLRDQVAAADFLSRYGRPHVAAENELLRNAAQLAIEDRARLAEVLARRGERMASRQLMASIWPFVAVEGRRAVVPDTTRPDFYFNSVMRPLARILTATLAVDPQHQLIGPLVESLAQQGKAERATWLWNTQDYASAIHALAAFDRSRGDEADRSVRVRSGRRVVFQSGASSDVRDSIIALTGLVSGGGNARALRLALDAGPGEQPVYYYLTVTTLETTPPVSPQDNGIRVERWYERYESATPVTSVAEGDLVRVRLRITVPSTRNFVVLDDALPAGLEAVDLSLRTASLLPGPGAPAENPEHEENEQHRWSFGRWDSGWWTPFDYREIRDDRVVYSATVLWPGTYTATYIARATTPGTFIKPSAHAEEMYNPAVRGESDAGIFTVTPRNR